MSIDVIGWLTLVAGMVALTRSPAFGLSLMIPMTLLGAAGAVLLGGSGTIQPAHLFLGFVALSCLAHGSVQVMPTLRFPGPGFWLVAFTVVAVATAFLFPRLFAGATAINAVGTTEDGSSPLLVPLAPTSGNTTQSIYIVADALCFLLCSAVGTQRRGYRVLSRAATAYCIINILFAVADIVTFWTNTTDLLSFIRNADYQLHVETVVTGLKRIVGSFTETSSFAYATLGALGFSARLGLNGVQPRLFLSIAAISLTLLVFSTSTTAYAAAPVLIAWIYGTTLRRAVKERVARAAMGFLVLAPLFVSLLMLGILLQPQLRNTIHDTVTTLILEKSQSQSGLERAQWNNTALRNFIDTNGFGAGLGSVRASSFPIALISNTGVVGSGLFALFLATVFMSGRPGERRDDRGLSRHARRDWLAAPEPASGEVLLVQDAARTACLGLLVGATVSGALVDLGLQFFVFAALATTVPQAVGVAATARTRVLPRLPRHIPASAVRS